MALWLLLNLLISNFCNPLLTVQTEKLTIADNISAPAQTSAKAPIVEWLTERDHDFQHLRKEHPKTFVFKFKNIYQDSIILQTVRTSCGCTAATWTEGEIAPQGIGQIVVEYDAYMRGEFRKKIMVFFDRQRKPELLWIHGEVD
jgi:hypothetical protein